jgi:LPPG:FO 2-phospho-L-lactate transferase
VGVAARYGDLIDTFVMDEVDAALRPAVDAFGLDTLVTDTIMRDDAGRARLAREILRFAETRTIA